MKIAFKGDLEIRCVKDDQMPEGCPIIDRIAMCLPEALLHVPQIAIHSIKDFHLDRKWLLSVPNNHICPARWSTWCREGIIDPFAKQPCPEMGIHDCFKLCRFGLIRQRWQVLNQDREVVMTMEGWGMYGRRPETALA